MEKLRKRATNSKVVLGFLSKRTIAQIEAILYAITILKRISISFGAIVILVVVVQLLYPSGRALPLQKLANGQSIGFNTTGQLQSTFEKLTKEPMQFTVQNQSVSYTLQEIGVAIDVQASARAFSDYPLVKRLLPFSILGKGGQVDFDRKIDTAKVDSLVEKIAAEYSISPLNASYELNESEYKLVASQVGAEYMVPELKRDFSQLRPDAPRPYVLQPQETQPVISDAVMQHAIDDLNAVSRHDLMLDGTKVPSDKISSWAIITTNEKDKTAYVDFDTALMKEWLSGLSLPGQIAARPTVIRYFDQREIGRTVGRPGRGIELDKTTEAIIEALRSRKPTASITYAELPITEVAERQFSATDQGLELLLKNWRDRYPGMKASVSFFEIGGRGRKAELDGNVSFTAASMYKLHLAQYALEKVVSGGIGGDEVVGGKTVLQCVEAMIVRSENQCAESLAQRFGWTAIGNAMKQKGFTGTNFKGGNYNMTANDTTQFLLRLFAGGLLPEQETNSMLQYMQQQIYRSAIPAGSPGALVRNKVGFNQGLWHDGAIVEIGGTTYVLSVFTEGGSPGAIAALAREINETIRQ